MKTIGIILLLIGLFCAGCGDQEKKDGITHLEEPNPPNKQAANPNQESKVLSRDDIAEKTAAMKKATGDLANAIQEKAAPLIEKSKENVVELGKTIHQKTQPMVTKTKETTFAAIESVKEKSNPIVVAALENATELTEKATEKVRGINRNEITDDSPEVVVLKNKKGTIVFAHKKHTATFKCTICHGEIKPGPITLGKAAGHAFCKGCHKEQGAGPTKCSGCHAVVRKPVEGC